MSPKLDSVEIPVSADQEATNSSDVSNKIESVSQIVNSQSGEISNTDSTSDQTKGRKFYKAADESQWGTGSRKLETVNENTAARKRRLLEKNPDSWVCFGKI